MAKLNGVKTVDMTNGEITKVAYEGSEYTLIGTDVEAKSGDLVQSNVSIMDVSEGDFFKTFERNNGDISFKDGDNYYRDASYGEGRYNIFRKISADKPTIEQRIETLESDVAALKGEKKADEPKRLTVGDIAKITGTESHHFGEIGDIVKIKIDEEDRQPYKCERISDGKNVGWFYEEDLEAYAEATIEFEGATYRKVDREARGGDVVIFNGVDSYSTDNGKPYKVLSGRNYVGNTGTKRSVYGWGSNPNVDVYEPIEQAKYVPQEGDIVVITANTSGHANKIGDIGTVGKEKPLSDGGVNVYVPEGPTNAIRTKPCDMRKATPAEVEKYEQAMHKASFAVGDYVKVTDDFCDKVVSVGDICEIVHDDGTNLPFKLKRLSDGKISGYMYAHGLVKATDAEIEKAKAPKLKAGDFVKITRKRSYYDNDKIYEVRKDNGGDLYVIDEVGDAVYGAISDGEYEILSAEEAKWAKIGRQPNEFKKGDVVRVVEMMSSRFAVGTLGIVMKDEIDSCRRPTTEAITTEGKVKSYHPRVELVSPVESLFN